MIVDKAVPETFAEKVVTFPRSCLGDGLAIDASTGNLYSASEGDFLPLNGVVYMIDTNTSRNIPPAHTHPGQSAATTNAATVHPILTKYFATDGAYMDDVKKVLYVSEVYGHKVIAVSIDNTSNVREFTAPGMLSLDDFTLSEVRRLQAQAST